MNKLLFDEKVKSKGTKYKFLAEKLGITETGLIKKREGVIPFKVCEINALTDLLSLTADERDIIFGLTSPK